MSDFTAWSRAYEQFLHDRHDKLVEVARIRRRALVAGTINATVALFVGSVALFLSGGWRTGLLGALAVMNAILVIPHAALVFRIDCDIAAADLTIEFTDAQNDLRR